MHFKYEMNKHIESVQLIEGKLHVVIRESSNAILLSNPPQRAPDDIYKEIYAAKDGAIVLEKTIVGTHKPLQVIPETFIFEDNTTGYSTKKENIGHIDFNIERGITWSRDKRFVESLDTYKDEVIYGGTLSGEVTNKAIIHKNEGELILNKDNTYTGKTTINPNKEEQENG